VTTYATDTFAGDGSKVEFDLTFKFIERDHVTVSRLVKATLQATVLTVIQTGTPTGDEFIWESDTKIKVGTAPTSDQELVIARDTPENDQIVKWADGSYIIAADLNQSDLQWLYGLQELEDKFGKLQSTAIKYLGAIDLTVDAAPASPLNGDFYINTGSGPVLDSWTGIGGDDVVGSEQVVYNGNISEWQIFQVPSSQSGVLQVKGTAPITIDDTDVQRPVVEITNATTSADGAMSASDKDKLDNIAPGAEVNVNADWNAASGDAEILNKPTIPAAQVNSDWDATSGVAEILNKPTVIDGDAPSDGKTYGRKNAKWSEVQPGGVTKIIAGSNVTISPTGGTGDVTVNATGGSSNMPTGGSGEDAFYENTTTIDNNYQIAAGKNAGTFGPVTVNGDVTVPSGSTWTVVGGAGGGSGGTPGVRYQSGTWTPAMHEVSNVTNATTADFNPGGAIWTRNGDWVTVTYSLLWTGVGQYALPAVNSYIAVKDLPYAVTPANFAGTWGTSAIGAVGAGGEIALSTSNILYMYGSGAVANTTGTLFGSITYRTDDTTWNPDNDATVTTDIQGGGGSGGGGDSLWTVNASTNQVSLVDPAQEVIVESFAVSNDTAAASGIAMDGSGDDSFIGLHADNASFAVTNTDQSQTYLSVMSDGVFTDGTITSAGAITAGGGVQASGFICRAGIEGDYGNTFNVFWTSTSQVQIWIDNSQIVTMSAGSYSPTSLYFDPENNTLFGSNLELHLDPDDPSKVLDVKERLLEFQAKIETLEAAKAALEARITTLEGGSN